MILVMALKAFSSSIQHVTAHEIRHQSAKKKPLPPAGKHTLTRPGSQSGTICNTVRNIASEYRSKHHTKMLYLQLDPGLSQAGLNLLIICRSGVYAPQKEIAIRMDVPPTEQEESCWIHHHQMRINAMCSTDIINASSFSASKQRCLSKPKVIIASWF